VGLHASPRSRPGACDDCDVFARDRQLGPTPGVVGHADDEEGAATLMAAAPVRAAFVAFETAEPIDRFAVHVNDSVVWIQLDPDEEPTAGLLDAMHGLSQALVSSPGLPSTPAARPLRRSPVARVLFVLLAPPAFFVAVLGLGFGVGEWAAFAATALVFGGVLWASLRRYLRRGSRR
jgi:hypothetical protein